MRRTKNFNFAGCRETSKETRPARKGFVFGAILIALLAVVLVFQLNDKSKPTVPAPKLSAMKTKVANFEPMLAPEHFVTPPPATPSPAVASQPALISPEFLSADQLVDELSKIGNGPITAEQAARFKEDLKELIRRGAASVPAIQKFLDQNMDTTYADVKGGDQLGYSSLRASLIDSLNQIGGPEAQSVMLKTMQTTAVPAELLELANDLNKQSPGEYQDEIVKGAQETLDMASSGQLGTNTEVGPAFHTMQTFDNGNTTADVADNDPLQFYAAVELANMPDGAGLSSLVQMEQNSTGDSQVIATEMIAQLAGQNPDALSTLAQMAQNGQIGQDVWVKLAPILGGDQYQIDSSGQDYAVVGGVTTPTQINQRIAMIDTFMNFAPAGSAAATALQQERAILVGKLNTN